MSIVFIGDVTEKHLSKEKDGVKTEYLDLCDSLRQYVDVKPNLCPNNRINRYYLYYMYLSKHPENADNKMILDLIESSLRKFRGISWKKYLSSLQKRKEKEADMVYRTFIEDMNIKQIEISVLQNKFKPNTRLFLKNSELLTQTEPGISYIQRIFIEGNQALILKHFPKNKRMQAILSYSERIYFIGNEIENVAQFHLNEQGYHIYREKDIYCLRKIGVTF